MPELKQPQEAAKTTTEQPLTTKKKRAMLEYMAIMFAAAFLLVAISLLIKVIDMKGEMEAANTGARENIALLQKDLDAARARVRRAADQARRGQHRVLRGSGQALGRRDPPERGRKGPARRSRKRSRARRRKTTRSPAARRPMSCSSRRRPRWSRAIMPPSAAISRRSGPMPTP